MPWAFDTGQQKSLIKITDHNYVLLGSAKIDFKHAQA